MRPDVAGPPIVSVALLLLLAFAPDPSGAADHHSNSKADRAHGAPKKADLVLYELSENACLVDASGQCVFDASQAVARVAVSSLQGIAKLGTMLCPSSVFVTDLKTDACTVTATGNDTVSLVDTGSGALNGTFSVVIQLDNPVDSPELPVLTGTFDGTIDFTPTFLGIPLGFATATLTVTESPLDPTLVGLSLPFTGVFRQPFAMGPRGQRRKPHRGEEAFYLVDGEPVPVRQDERAVGWPTVRFEITFSAR